MNWRAIVVEFIEGLWDRGIRYLDAFLKPLHDAWYDDWVEWKAQETMKDLDRQIEKIHEGWAAEDPKPIIIEHEPDGSKAQELLGGTLQIKAPWYDQTDD